MDNPVCQTTHSASHLNIPWYPHSTRPTKRIRYDIPVWDSCKTPPKITKFSHVRPFRNEKINFVFCWKSIISVLLQGWLTITIRPHRADWRWIIIECVKWCLIRYQNRVLTKDFWESLIELLLNIIWGDTSYINFIFEKRETNCYGALTTAI